MLVSPLLYLGEWFSLDPIVCTCHWRMRDLIPQAAGQCGMSLLAYNPP